MKNCRHCELTLESTANYCGNCGAPVKADKKRPNDEVMVIIEGDPRRNGKAVAALVVGIVGIPTSLVLMPALNVAINVTGLVLGVSGKKSQRASFAQAGIILSIIGLLLTGVVFIYLFTRQIQ